MKRKYPGLRKSFSNGYTELDEQDFFDTEGTDLDRYSLIDRINLHFKIGLSSLIPFNEEEKVFINRIENLETFEEVCKIAVEIYEFSKEKRTRKSRNNRTINFWIFREINLQILLMNLRLIRRST